MRLKEQRLWDTLSSHAPKSLWLQRVENLVMAGMPDVYVGESCAWVELKAPIAPKRSTTRLLGDDGLNPDQINWHLKAARTSGTKSFVLIRDSNSRLYLVPGNFAATINEMTAGELDVYSVASSWERIIEELGAIVKACPNCSGRGWIEGRNPSGAAHDDEGNCQGMCPVQEQCERCGGTGTIK